MGIQRYDVGHHVECDGCSKDFTESSESGGLIFGSNGYGPCCGPGMEATAIEYGEQEFIRGRCPAGTSFADWIRGLRGPDAAIVVRTGADAEQAIFGTRNEGRMRAYSPIEVAIALSLYGYNVAAANRANSLVQWFDARGLPCRDADDIARVLHGGRGQYAATELPYPTAKLYVQQALERYGEEAARRALAEEQAV